jgi:hypothetical protein
VVQASLIALLSAASSVSSTQLIPSNTAHSQTNLPSIIVPYLPRRLPSSLPPYPFQHPYTRGPRGS